MLNTLPLVTISRRRLAMLLTLLDYLTTLPQLLANQRVVHYNMLFVSTIKFLSV
jgi:hypothetical protein